MATTTQGRHPSLPKEEAVSFDSISKSFGGLQALREITWVMPAGKVSALVGDNGAGKSTLLKVLSGALEADDGEIRLWGDPVQIRSPEEARVHGIETVYQDLALVPTLPVYANMFLGSEMTSGGRIGRWLGLLDRRKMMSEAAHLLSRIRVGIKGVSERVDRLSGGQQQGIAIGRSLQSGGGILLLDEPTAALGTVESERVFEQVKRLRHEGYTILLVSHNLEEVVGLADKVAVLRQGRLVAECEGADVTRDRLVDILKA